MDEGFTQTSSAREMGFSYSSNHLCRQVVVDVGAFELERDKKRGSGRVAQSVSYNTFCFFQCGGINGSVSFSIAGGGATYLHVFFHYYYLFFFFVLNSLSRLYKYHTRVDLSQ